MKMTPNAQAALHDPENLTKTIELTPELRKKYGDIAELVINLLQSKTTGPIEGYMVLQFIVQYMEDQYGIKGGIILEKSDYKQSQ